MCLAAERLRTSTSSPPFFAAGLHTVKCAVSLGSDCMGVMGALFSFFHARPSVGPTTLLSRPASALSIEK